MKLRRWILIGILIWVVLMGAGLWAGSRGLLPIFMLPDFSQPMEGFPPGQDGLIFMDGEGMPIDMMGPESVPVQRADAFIPDVVAPGKLALSNITELLAPVDASVVAVKIALGDSVQYGQELVNLDTSQLSANLEKQLLELNKARDSLAKLFANETQADLLTANAELLEAQEALNMLENGPEAADLNDALLKIREAQASLQKLEQKNDPNSQAVREARFSLSEARNSLETAQKSYEAISWRGDLAASAEAEALKNATISLERTQLAYDEAIAPTDPVALESAQLAVSRAQAEYAKLVAPPSEAEVEKARARVSKAEQELAKLQEGPTTLAVQEAESAVMDALTQVEETRLQLLKIEQLTAPSDGTIVKLPVKAGQSIKQGDPIASIAADNRFKIEVSVNELFILDIAEGMEAQIVVDVLPNEQLPGQVVQIVPTELSSDESGLGGNAGNGGSLTSFPVKVELLDSPLLPQLRAGMSAEVTFIGSNQLAPNSWLVPINGVTESGDGDTATIELLRDGIPESLQVTLTDQTQGEWRVVISDELKEGDFVVGSTTSFLDQSGLPEGFEGP